MCGYYLIGQCLSSIIWFLKLFLSIDLVDTKADSTISGRQEAYEEKRDGFSDLGPLKGNERQDLNRAVKEYLLIAGYRLTAMTFYEEVCTMEDYGPFVVVLFFELVVV